MGCEAGESFKQLGSPEDASNQHLHSHLKGGITSDEGTTHPLPLAVRGCNASTGRIGAKELKITN